MRQNPKAAGEPSNNETGIRKNKKATTGIA